MDYKALFFIFSLLLSILWLKLSTHKEDKMTITNKKKNKNRKKQLKLRNKQVKRWERKLDNIINKIDEGEEGLKSEQFELARKIDQTKEEIKTLESRIT